MISENLDTSWLVGIKAVNAQVILSGSACIFIFSAFHLSCNTYSTQHTNRNKPRSLDSNEITY
jgi:hypothetical protein